MRKFKVAIVALFALFLMACGPALSDEELYDEAVSILETEFAEPNGYELEYSSLEMVEIEEVGDDLYEVRGNLFDQYQTGAAFTVKISVSEDKLNYEWLVE
ncbi:hypothetical protein [Virgibacillus ainsalahensis]